MQIFVRYGDLHTIDVTDSVTLNNIKQLILPSNNEEDSHVFSCSGIILDNFNVPLIEYGLEAESTIDVTCRLLGGKVHGSLARAGKVRGQTPKVEAKEKKKKKTGRAKRRMQYNRRFVNVVATAMGRKKGPNANSK